MSIKGEPQTPNHKGPDYSKWAELIIDSTNSPGQFLAKWWLDRFKKHPAGTTMLTLVIVVGIGITIYFTELHRRVTQEQERRQNLTINNQLDKLDKTEANIKELMQFVTDQRNRLQESEAIIQSLENHKKQLEPIVNADRAVVDAILNAQTHRDNSTVWRERGIGFALGVLSSLVATIIWSIGTAFWKRQQSQQSVA